MRVSDKAVEGDNPIVLKYRQENGQWFYLDGDTEPTYEWDFHKLCTGAIDPFMEPLVLFSFMAGVTQRIEFTTGILIGSA